mmetsp:Transcript_4061/g.16350  ORF Transcript_4061/g.16350 Transcript_4061/m.16350 type:complete len:220 (+) Transcript_4061:795-1454(+)
MWPSASKSRTWKSMVSSYRRRKQSSLRRAASSEPRSRRLSRPAPRDDDAADARLVRSRSEPDESSPTVEALEAWRSSAPRTEAVRTAKALRSRASSGRYSTRAPSSTTRTKRLARWTHGRLMCTVDSMMSANCAIVTMPESSGSLAAKASASSRRRSRSVCCSTRRSAVASSAATWSASLGTVGPHAAADVLYTRSRAAGSFFASRTKTAPSLCSWPSA